MPVINLFFWSVLLLVIYLSAAIAISYHRAEQKAIQELRRLQIRQQVRDICSVRRQKQTLSNTGYYDKSYRNNRVTAGYPSFAYGMENAHKQQITSLCPVKKINQFFDVPAHKTQHDMTELSFAWTRPGSVNQSERMNVMTKTQQPSNVSQREAV